MQLAGPGSQNGPGNQGSTIAAGGVIGRLVACLWTDWSLLFFVQPEVFVVLVFFFLGVSLGTLL